MFLLWKKKNRKKQKKIKLCSWPGSAVQKRRTRLRLLAGNSSLFRSRSGRATVIYALTSINVHRLLVLQFQKVKSKVCRLLFWKSTTDVLK